MTCSPQGARVLAEDSGGITPGLFSMSQHYVAWHEFIDGKPHQLAIHDLAKDKTTYVATVGSGRIGNVQLGGDSAYWLEWDEVGSACTHARLRNLSLLSVGGVTNQSLPDRCWSLLAASHRGSLLLGRTDSGYSGYLLPEGRTDPVPLDFSNSTLLSRYTMAIIGDSGAAMIWATRSDNGDSEVRAAIFDLENNGTRVLALGRCTCVPAIAADGPGDRWIATVGNSTIQGDFTGAPAVHHVWNVYAVQTAVSDGETLFLHEIRASDADAYPTEALTSADVATGRRIDIVRIQAWPGSSPFSKVATEDGWVVFQVQLGPMADRAIYAIPTIDLAET